MDYMCWTIIFLLLFGGVAYLVGANKLGDTAVEMIRLILMIFLIIVLIILVLYLLDPIRIGNFRFSIYHIPAFLTVKIMKQGPISPP